MEWEGVQFSEVLVGLVPLFLSCQQVQGCSTGWFEMALVKVDCPLFLQLASLDIPPLVLC